MKDSEFIRGDVPMTKEEIRTIALSKLELSTHDSLMDIGAGTGSVSIEAALQLTKGNVLAIEHKKEAVDLILENKEKHHTNNLEVVMAKAPDGMENIAEYNKFFIGGSGGNLNDILELIKNKAPQKSIVVVTAIVLDTMIEVYHFFKDNNYDFELIQVGVNKIDTTKKVAMLTAQNPIFILTGKVK
ncbi:precorrin-6Y C5,15-methyltransferase (decarboxylating) subunit CbiT [Plebeiibacterium marinum]|uniref:Precorrin-6Y C5,15-methyltransferase (Decarboxylating) subunit CbiT n=1 Tax=Plebeiibacterium marinum TaxID=2992111 RepID=A0AAE3MG12_9BACT|nr:precorrin-6Y C5,15-methyltransferase (decarboxylating) subunit CbiT [Plebeiobacterium marinum]MCW3807178.1 precorrin-6Y C5,15-methyltransferase (decarboxylating) subunit CbiT [Plebeiobacterium marinum]